MPHQSPASKRSKAPGQKESNDNLPTHKSGGHNVPRQGPSGSGLPTVPKMPRGEGRSAGQGAGNSPRGETVSTSSASPPSGGAAGSASLAGSDAMRKGGTSERFASGRGGNS